MIIKKRNTHNVLLKLYAFLFFSVIAYSQDTYISECLTDNYEKVFLHMNNHVFTTGSNIDFKAYVYNGFSHTLSNKSKVLYFEVSNPEKTYLHWRSNINQGICYGSIRIPDSIPSGKYILRSYTNWNRNFDNNYLYSKEIIISNLTDIEKKEINYLQEKIVPPPIEVFPEGGRIMTGITNNIAISGLEKNKKYTLHDNNHHFIKHISSNKNGNAFFELFTQPGISYYINDSINTGANNIFIHPKDKGTGLYSTITDRELLIRVFNSPSPMNTINDARLVIRNKGIVVESMQIHLKSNLNTFRYEKNKFSAGLYHLALYDLNTKLLNEKLFYINPNDINPEIILNEGKARLTRRETAKLSIEINDLGPGETANFSIAISETDSIFPENNNNINYYTYVNSEINTDNIPEDFSEKSINSFLQIIPPDKLIWNENNIKGKNYTYFLEDQGYILCGKVTNRFTKRPLRNTTICLSVNSDQANLKYAVSNNEGIFYFHLEEALNNKRLFLQVYNHTIKHSDILWELFPKDVLNSTQALKRSFSDEEVKFLNYKNKIQISNSVFFPENSNQPNEKDTLLSDLHYFKPDYTVYPDEYIPLKDFTEISQNILPVVRYRFNKKTNEFSANIYDPDNHIIFEEQATVFLNGIILKDLSIIKDMGTDEIEKIEVITTKVYYGDMEFYGTVNIFTKNKDIAQHYIEENSLTFDNKVVPIYFNENNYLKNNLDNLPDLRQTLYWDPNVTVKKNENIQVSFITSDISGDYVVRLNGITSGGRFINNEIYFKVIH